jgi:ABC-type sugar transport system substrate-binding protein/anti-anti-sigma regulatory factor
MKDTRDVHICCILHNPGQTLWAMCGQGMRDQAHNLGVTLSLRSAFTDADHLSELTDCLAHDNADAIIFGGGDFSVPPDLAARICIPLITCLASVQGVPIACDVQADLRRAAALAASYLIEHLHGRGNIIHIQGVMHGMYTMPRMQGFTDTLAAYPAMRIVLDAHGNWDRASGAKIVKDALERHSDVQAIFAHSDEMALGAQAALEAAGRRDVIVVGIDAIPETLIAIRNQTIAATVNIRPYTMGSAALTHAFELTQKRTVPSEVRTDVQLITVDSLLDAMFDTVQTFPNVLRDQMQAYQAQRQLQKEIIATQRRLIEELSTPIIPVSDSILVVPLIGAIDSRRASQITTSVLEKVGQQATQVLIFDITGVSVVDTSVINHLLQTTGAARLLGATVLLVGIAPEIAQTIVQLGVDLSGIITRSTLQAGLEYANTYLRRVNTRKRQA